MVDAAAWRRDRATRLAVEVVRRMALEGRRRVLHAGEVAEVLELGLEIEERRRARRRRSVRQAREGMNLP